MNIVIYGNGSSKNHGCEAIIRGTANLFSDSYLVIRSIDPVSDLEYHIDNLAVIKTAKTGPSIRSFIVAYLKYKFFGNQSGLDYIYYEKGIREDYHQYQIALSVGGDNYCYGNTDFYAWLNNQYKSIGMRTVLWGCSIERDIVLNPKVQPDLCRYDLIVARESLTYAALKEIKANVILAPDPAFYMESIPCDLNRNLMHREIIGINASPVVIQNEKIKGIVLENYQSLINYILETTDAVIALIPHVIASTNDDRETLQQISELFGDEDRIVTISDYNAMEIKYIISKCSFFIGSRTHATIAAYSTAVPTIAVGYSIKARGIALDLFGTENNFVVDARKLTHPDCLLDSFKKLYFNRSQIHKKLKKKLIEYLADGEKRIKDSIQTLSASRKD